MDLQYNTYLNLFYQEFDTISQERERKQKISLLKPCLKYSENKRKTIIVNIIDICQKFKREPENFISFIKKEITQDKCYINGENQLIIYQYLTIDNVKKIMVNYCKLFITCKTCKNINTDIKRDNTMKKNLLICNFCNNREYLSH